MIIDEIAHEVGDLLDRQEPGLGERLRHVGASGFWVGGVSGWEGFRAGRRCRGGYDEGYEMSTGSSVSHVAGVADRRDLPITGTAWGPPEQLSSHRVGETARWPRRPRRGTPPRRRGSRARAGPPRWYLRGRSPRPGALGPSSPSASNVAEPSRVSTSVVAMSRARPTRRRLRSGPRPRGRRTPDPNPRGR